MRIKFKSVSCFVAAAVLGAVSLKASAHETPAKVEPIIYATAWGLTLAQDGSGFYNEVAADLLAKEGEQSSYHLMPYKRAKARFIATGEGCLYPSSIDVMVAGNEIADASSLIQTAEIMEVSTHLFAPSGVEPPRSMADLKGKRIALPAGSVMNELLKGAGAKLIGVNDESDKAAMLVSGRTELMSGMMPDTAMVFEHMGQPLPEFDANFSFLKVGLAIVCHKSEATEALVGRINARLAELVNDEAYNSRFERAGLVPAKHGPGVLNAIMPANGRSPIPVSAGRRMPHFQRR